MFFENTIKIISACLRIKLYYRTAILFGSSSPGGGRRERMCLRTVGVLKSFFFFIDLSCCILINDRKHGNLTGFQGQFRIFFFTILHLKFSKTRAFSRRKVHRTLLYWQYKNIENPIFFFFCYIHLKFKF